MCVWLVSVAGKHRLTRNQNEKVNDNGFLYLGLGGQIIRPMYTESEREREMFYLMTHSTHFI